MASLERSLKKDLTIACSENSVQVIELQKEGKKSNDCGRVY